MSKRSRLGPVVKIVFRILICVILIGVASGIYRSLEASKPVPERVDPSTLARRTPVVTLQAMSLPRQWTGYGTARALQSADIPARVTAAVTEIPATVEAGESIGTNGLIAKLDDREFVRRRTVAERAIASIDARLERLDVDARSLNQQIENADERVMLAERELSRIEAARAQDAARDREVDAAQTALLAAKRTRIDLQSGLDLIPVRRAELLAERGAQVAQIELAETDVERTRIVNPLVSDGRMVIQALDVEVGENVMIGSRIARVIDPSRIEVPLQIPASARSYVSVGDDVLITPVGADQSTSVPSTIARIAPEDDPMTRTMTVYVDLRVEQTAQVDGISGIPAPGRFVRGRVSGKVTSGAIVVPRRSIDDGIVYVVTAPSGGRGIVRGTRVEILHTYDGPLPETGLSDTAWAIVEGDLSAGAQLIIEPSRQIVDGTEVLPVERAAAGSDS